MFCARLPSIFSTSHKMPRLPRIFTLSPLDAAPATKNDDGHVQRAAAGRKTAPHLLTRSQEYCACHAKRLSKVARTRLNVRKSHAFHAKRNNDTLATAKKDYLCKLPIGTALWSSRRPLRTVATVSATASEHTPHPQTPRVKREPVLRIRLLSRPCRFFKSHGFHTPTSAESSRPMVGKEAVFQLLLISNVSQHMLADWKGKNWREWFFSVPKIDRAGGLRADLLSSE